MRLPIPPPSQETKGFFVVSKNPFCAPGRIRTCDLRIRSPVLYPAELRTQKRGHGCLCVLVRKSIDAPGRSRTCDLRIRSPLLYPAELQALGKETLFGSDALPEPQKTNGRNKAFRQAHRTERSIYNAFVQDASRFSSLFTRALKQGAFVGEATPKATSEMPAKLAHDGCVGFSRWVRVLRVFFLVLGSKTRDQTRSHETPVLRG